MDEAVYEAPFRSARAPARRRPPTGRQARRATTRALQPARPAVDINHAVARNRVHRQSLSWQPSLDGIVRYLGFGTRTPDEPRFAEAVARWQQDQNGLTVDGILGPQTWGRMRGAIGPVPSVDIDRAMRRNRDYSRSLGWGAYASTISRLIGFATSFPSERQFAGATGRWQRAQGGLVVDGILGPRSLARMESALRQPELGLTPDGQAELFVTHIPPIPPASGPSRIPGAELGHEILTERAARRAGIVAGDPLDAALRAGVTRVDIGRTTTLPFGIELPLELPAALVHAVDPAEQSRHALRGGPDLCQDMATALRGVRNRLIALHGNALRAPTRVAAFESIGEALHLIQDSYSQAHTEREWAPAPPHRIRYIRFFARVINPFTIPPRSPLIRGRAPHEHQFPTDNRDSIFNPGASLKPEALRAIDASHEFLVMIVRHLPGPPSSRTAAGLRRFMNRHLALHPTPHEPGMFHPGTCP
ncbi:MAG: peptidoglycan-binding domain-containing protein [Actinomycetota bacterium]